MNEEVGKISYVVTIDTASLRAGTKTAEQAIKGSFGNSQAAVATSTNSMNRSIQSTILIAAALTASLLALRKLGNFLGDSIDSANKFQAAMLGLDSVASAFTGESDKALKAAQDLSKDGLLPLAESATSLKNLLAAGFGLEQAITLVDRFKDSAAFGRQGSLSFGEAVKTATEGIKNGNSILVDNAGVTKNLSVILQEAGYSAQDMMHASTDAGVRLAIFNGIIRETNAQVGDAAKLADTAAGADAALGFSMNLLEVRAGDLANAIRKDLVLGMSEYIAKNQDMIISLGAGTTAFFAFGAVALGAVKAIKSITLAVRTLGIVGAVAKLRMGLLLGALSAIAGIVVSGIVGNLLEEMDSTAEGAEKAADGTGKMANAFGEAGDSAKKLGKDLRKINDDYLQSLAEIVQRHQKSIKQLTSDISDENSNYKQAIKERLDSFTEEQYKEGKEHGKKTKSLQNQIDFLRKYNNASNRQQLSELQFALAKENAEYGVRNKERVEKYNEDAEAERLTHEKRLASFQANLDEETGVLNKHADEVKSIRGVILDDEIQKLIKSRDAQITSARESAKGVADAFTANQIASTLGSKKVGDTLGDAMGKSFMRGLQKAIGSAWSKFWSDIWKGVTNFIDDMFTRIRGYDPSSGAPLSKKEYKTDSMGVIHWTPDRRASGGPVSAGTPYFVGDNRDGSLNSTSELFVPKQSGTIVPANEVQDMIGSSNTSNNYSVNINVSGAIVSSPQDQRKFAEVIGKRLNEVMQQKGFQPAIEGI